jgi:hypothetical protein
MRDSRWDLDERDETVAALRSVLEPICAALSEAAEQARLLMASNEEWQMEPYLHAMLTRANVLPKLRRIPGVTAKLGPSNSVQLCIERFVIRVLKEPVPIRGGKMTRARRYFSSNVHQLLMLFGDSPRAVPVTNLFLYWETAARDLAITGLRLVCPDGEAEDKMPTIRWNYDLADLIVLTADAETAGDEDDLPITPRPAFGTEEEAQS